MHLRKSLLVFGIVLALCLIIALFVKDRRDGRGTPSQTSDPLSAGAASRTQLCATSQRHNFRSESLAARATLKGELETKLIAADSASYLTEVVFSDLQLSASDSSKVFPKMTLFVVYSSGGSVEQLFSSKQSPANEDEQMALASIQSIVLTMQYVPLASFKGRNSIERTERTANGAQSVAYQLLEDGRIAKHRDQSENHNDAASNGVYKLRDGAFVEEMNVSETWRNPAAEEGVANTEASFELHLRDMPVRDAEDVSRCASAEVMALVQELGLKPLDLDLQTQVASAPSSGGKLHTESSLAKNLNDLKQSARDSQERRLAVDHLATSVTEAPLFAERIEREILSNLENEDYAGALLGVLGEAWGPAAQESLGRLMTRFHAENHRLLLRAIREEHLNASPSASNVVLLQKIAADTNLGRETRESASLAAGATAKQLNDPEVKSAMSQQMMAAFTSAASEREQQVAIETLGNMAHTDNIDFLMTTAHSRSPALAASSVTALRMMPNELVEQPLQKLALDPNLDIQSREIALELLATKKPSGDTVAKLIKLFDATPDQNDQQKRLRHAVLEALRKSAEFGHAGVLHQFFVRVSGDVVPTPSVRE